MVDPGPSLNDPTHRWYTFCIFAIYTIPNVAGLVMMKYALSTARDAWQSGDYFGWQSFLVLIGAALYVLGFVIWLAILARYELSQAYPIAIGLTLVFSSVASRIVLGETLSLTRIIGMVVIFFGIWLVAH